MKNTLIAVGFVALLGLGSVVSSDCKKKEEDAPPPPPAAPTPTPAPTPVVIVTEEQVPDAAEDVAPDVKKKVIVAAPADVAGLRACCTALQQNAASMPPPNNTYALQAASVCQSLVSALAAGSTSKAGALGSIGSVLKGANLPPACK